MKRLPGFRDFPPEELAVRSRVFDAWRGVSRRFGFQEYDGPPLEPVDLYVRKSGAEILGQLYEFTDKGDRHVALRPEMTPSLARILAERSRALPKPIRWFSMPQLFRYERQQKGRLREHYQWNVDIVGEAGTGADAEVLAVALGGLGELGLTHEDVVARVSDRPLIHAILSALDVGEEHHDAVIQIIDKLERAGDEWATEQLTPMMSGETAAKLLSTLRASNPESLRSAFSDASAVIERLSVVEEYLATLEALGLKDWVRLDLTIVRGLAYYTGLVFEVFARSQTMRAICGGGRYDRLLEMVGGEPQPAVGFGMGDVVLTDLLSELGRLPAYQGSVDVFVVTQSRSERTLCLEVASALRRAGHGVTYALSEASVRKQFKSAAAVGATTTLMLGPDEVARGVGKLHDMDSGDEREVALTSLLAGEGLVSP